MSTIRLPETVVLPWYLRPVDQRTIPELAKYVPWSLPVWCGGDLSQPYVCQWDGAKLRIETYVAYQGGSPEPVYVGWCPICETEYEL